MVPVKFLVGLALVLVVAAPCVFGVLSIVSGVGLILGALAREYMDCKARAAALSWI